MQLKLTHRGQPLQLLGDDPGTLGELRAKVATALSVPSENVRLLAEGKILAVDHDLTPLNDLFRPFQTVIVIATNSETITSVKSARPDPTLRPFDAKAPKYVAAPQRTAKTNIRYGFGRVHALPNLPDSDQAQMILEQLASDRGFLRVMEKKHWNVGELCEMPPEGRVGVDPVCVLGYNTNKGQKINLRLRTDDMKGFRAMYSIRQVLAHELAHNVFSEHDDNFKELMRWIEKTASRDSWETGGQRLEESWIAPDFGTNRPAATNASSNRNGQSLGHGVYATGVSRLLAEEATLAEGGEQVAEGERDAKVDSMNEEAEPTAAKPPERPAGRTERSTPISELVTLGFSSELAELALRENGQNATRAADWLLTQSSGPHRGSQMGQDEAEVTKRIGNALRGLGESLNSRQFVSALHTLHLYMSNVLRNPGVERFCRINDKNGGFQKRVGGFEDALQVLREAGFRLERGFWRYSSLDVSPVWIAKSLVQERLLEELMKRQGI